MSNGNTTTSKPLKLKKSFGSLKNTKNRTPKTVGTKSKSIIRKDKIKIRNPSF